MWFYLLRAAAAEGAKGWGCLLLNTTKPLCTRHSSHSTKRWKVRLGCQGTECRATLRSTDQNKLRDASNVLAAITKRCLITSLPLFPLKKYRQRTLVILEPFNILRIAFLKKTKYHLVNPLAFNF